MGYTVFAWIASLVGSLALGFGVYSAAAVRALSGVTSG